MNATMKAGLAAVIAVFIADKVAGTFTDSGDSDSEKLIWKVAVAGVVGAAASKLL